MSIKTEVEIIYISSSILTEARVYEFGITYLEKKGVNVQIWTLQSNSNDQTNYFDKQVSDKRVRFFPNIIKYERAVKKLSKTAIFILVSGGELPYVWYPLCKYNCYYYVCGRRSDGPQTHNPDYDTSTLHSLSEHGCFISRLIRMVHEYRFGVMKRILREIHIKCDRVITKKYQKKHDSYEDIIYKNPPQAVFAANEVSKKKMIELLKWTHLENLNYIYVPSIAYNEYLINENKGGDVSEDFILFAVAGAGFKNYGPGSKAYTWKIYNETENKIFLQQIDKLLTGLEKYYNCKTIVRGHPRVDYTGVDLGGRKIEYGDTVELTKKCKVFVSAFSTVWAFPIFYNKKVVFFYNNTIKESPLWSAGYLAFLEELGLSGLNMDDKEKLEKPWEHIEEFEEQKRLDYIRKYHGDLNNRKSFFEILFESILETHHVMNNRSELE